MRGITILTAVTCILFTVGDGLPAHSTNMFIKRADNPAHGSLAELVGVSKAGTRSKASVGGSGQPANANKGTKSVP